MTQPKATTSRAAAFLAACAMCLAAPAALATNMLLPNGTVCSFSGISVQMDGSFVLMCPTVPAGGTPVVSVSPPAQIPVSASGTGMPGGVPAMGDMPTAVYIVASPAPTADLMVMYDIAGTGCYANGFPPPAMGGVTIVAGMMQSQAIGIVATYPGSICSIAITSVSPMGGATIGPMTGMQASRADIPVGF